MKFSVDGEIKQLKRLNFENNDDLLNERFDHDALFPYRNTYFRSLHGCQPGGLLTN